MLTCGRARGSGQGGLGGGLARLPHRRANFEGTRGTRAQGASAGLCSQGAATACDGGRAIEVRQLRPPARLDVLHAEGWAEACCACCATRRRGERRRHDQSSRGGSCTSGPIGPTGTGGEGRAIRTEHSFARGRALRGRPWRSDAPCTGRRQVQTLAGGLAVCADEEQTVDGGRRGRRRGSVAGSRATGRMQPRVRDGSVSRTAADHVC